MAMIKKDVTRAVENIFAIDFENLMSLPCCVFWKNISGLYQGYNEYGAKSLGYNRVQDIIGKYDTDVFLPDKAQIYRNNDCKVMQNKHQIIVAEEGVLKKNAVIFLSYKIPLFDKEGSLQGIMGLSFTRRMHKMDSPSSHDDTALNELTHIFSAPLQENPLYSQVVLSARERVCIDHLSHGLTIKQIAKILSLSPRTIETYIDRLKTKFNCKNKAELLIAYVEYLSYLVAKN